MGFIRTKTLKGNNYAYLVENRWRRKTSKQRVKKYLGRVIPIHTSEDVDFSTFINCQDILEYAKANPAEKIIEDLLVYEIYKAGFKKVDGLKWLCNGFLIDLEKKTASRDCKNVVLKLHDGFLCCDTIEALYSFNRKGRTKKDALSLARIFIDAGINIPKELFIEYFEKINKDGTHNFY
jgi:hypothetical protein